jgi:hypothetical protein
MLRGFDAQFSSIEDYILKITASIWEGGQMGDIERYYSRECVVESPLSVSRGIQPVIDGTAATLQSFPDRRLLAEAVLVSGSDEIGFLSSHRILSPMVHAGSGRFGVPTNKPIFVRTIADCVCRDNQIQHEWLVRDHGAIARQIGVLPSVLAQDWLRLDQNWQPPPPTTAPTPFRPIIDESRLCKTYIQSLHDTYGSLRSRFEVRPIGLSAEGVIAWHPGGFTSVGRHQRMGRIASLLDGLSFHSLDVEHCARHPHIRPGIESISCRFRARFVHNQYGHFGEPTGSIVSVLVIQHSELQDGMVFREWTLLDEVSIWMQVLSGRRGPK